MGYPNEGFSVRKKILSWFRLGEKPSTLSKMDVAASVAGQTQFTVDLYKTLVKGKESENVVLSPLSVDLALAMLTAGAKGPTREQISKCIKLPQGKPLHDFSSHLRKTVLSNQQGDGGPELALANRLWVEQSVKLKPAFQKILQESYGSEAASVDFISKAAEALAKVNKWAKDETHGKIENLLPAGSVDHDTRVVLANALYFKGAWKKQFDDYHTREEDFYLLDGKTIKVSMMHTSQRQYVKSFPTFKALRLPYSAGHDERLFSMFILLPSEKYGLVELEKALDAKTLAEDLQHVKQLLPVSKFELPKFKISSGFEVPKALESMGLTLPFGREADLTEMLDSPVSDKLYVSNIYHKTFVEVNEKGTEAAAATALTVTAKSLQMYTDDPVEFVCDHPFMFVIKEEHSNVVIFTGRVTDPSLAQ
ncbi:serpin-Z2B [Physcomitrium patens]|nr:serpin-Z2B-like [Physcomitrium patens]|eukprot:XP_024389351.1 serpin-Z2B-like [Physcomitrella patens]